MKIKEFYAQDLLDIAELHSAAGINKVTGKLEPCTDLSCLDCALYKFCIAEDLSCTDKFKELMNIKIKNIKWEDVQINTKVLCKYSANDKNWEHRYFAGVDYKGNPTIFEGGATSWSCSRDPEGTPRTSKYPIIILAEIDLLTLINNMES